MITEYWLCWEDPADAEAWVLRAGTDLVCSYPAVAADDVAGAQKAAAGTMAEDFGVEVSGWTRPDRYTPNYLAEVVAGQAEPPRP
ncbi:MAG TPA: hypothetical protein VFB06_11180 [Streptosporangiaceae bacterium]|nr:hypothetical protein [Streptosporangiaceae bacterium]